MCKLDTIDDMKAHVPYGINCIARAMGIDRTTLWRHAISAENPIVKNLLRQNSKPYGMLVYHTVNGDDKQRVFYKEDVVWFQSTHKRR